MSNFSHIYIRLFTFLFSAQLNSTHNRESDEDNTSDNEQYGEQFEPYALINRIRRYSEGRFRNEQEEGSKGGEGGHDWGREACHAHNHEVSRQDRQELAHDAVEPVVLHFVPEVLSTILRDNKQYQHGAEPNRIEG